MPTGSVSPASDRFASGQTHSNGRTHLQIAAFGTSDERVFVEKEHRLARLYELQLSFAFGNQFEPARNIW